MRQFFKKHIFELIITFIIAILFWINYKPGTYLTGWDNLQTELNPTLAIKRAFFSVWQEYQSFGLTAGMGHAADLVRAIYVWLLTFIMPQNIVRYFFQFSMLLIGSLGMYKLLQLTLQINVIANDPHRHREEERSDDAAIPSRLNLTLSGLLRSLHSLAMTTTHNDMFSFFGALFYLLNLGSVQIMGLPFESFSVFYAALPWCVWIFLVILEGAKRLIESHRDPIVPHSVQYSRMTNKKNLLLFFLINILATPLAVSQQLFVVYILVLGIITLGLSINQLLNPNDKTLISNQTQSSKPKTFELRILDFIRHLNFGSWILKKSAVLFLVIFSINSFWLLPQIYFLKTSGNVVQSAKVNQIATEDVYYSNFEKGTIPNFLSLQGFFFDRVGRNNTFLFQAWHESQKNPLVAGTIILFSIIPLVGFFHKSRYSLPFFLLYLLCMAAILIATLPFNLINELVRQNSFLNQVFRSPFTKFIIPYSLVASYFFASGLIVLFNLLNRFLTNPNNKTQMPNQAQSLKSKYLGNWKFGFDLKLGFWILDLRRLFTVIMFILIIIYSFPAFTGNYIAPEMKVKIPSRYFELMDYFKHIDKNARIAQLPDYTFWGWYFNKWGYNGSGFLWYGIEQPIISRTFDVWSSQSESYLWEMKSASEAEDKKRLMSVLEKYNVDYLIFDSSLLPVSSTLKGMQFDRIEKLLAESPKVDLVKSWQDLSLYKVKHDKPIKNFVSMAAALPNIGPKIKKINNDMAYLDYGDYKSDSTAPYQAYYPFMDLITQTHLQDKKWSITDNEDKFVLSRTLNINPDNYQLVTKKNNNLTDIKIEILKQNNLNITFPKILYNEFDIKKTVVANCSFGKDLKSQIQNDNLTITAKNGAIGCFEYNNPNLEQNISYIVKVANNNLEGRSMFFYILDQTKKQAFVEDRLKNKIEYYILPDRYEYGTGYHFSFQNTSYGGTTSTNELNNVSVFSFPDYQIKNLKFVRLTPPGWPVDCNRTPVGCPNGLPTGVANETIPKAQFINNFTARKINYFLYQVDYSSRRSLSRTPIRDSNNKCYGTPPGCSDGLPGGVTNETIILNQSFHPGWEAYYLPKRQIASLSSQVARQGFLGWWDKLQTYFPYFFGEKINNHFMINNWANGWEISQSQFNQSMPIQPNTDSTDSTIVILFWPQYLEFIGFIILIGTSALLFLHFPLSFPRKRESI